MQTLELQIRIPEDTFQKLHDVAEARGVSEADVVVQALFMFFAFEEPAAHSDYWFSVDSMLEDWNVMPEDWMLVKS
jgi:hypothetical protein